MSLDDLMPEQIEACRARAGKQWSMAFLHPRSLGLETSFLPPLDLPPVERVLTDEWDLNSWSIGDVHFWWQSLRKMCGKRQNGERRG